MLQGFFETLAPRDGKIIGRSDVGTPVQLKRISATALSFADGTMYVLSGKGQLLAYR